MEADALAQCAVSLSRLSILTLSPQPCPFPTLFKASYTRGHHGRVTTNLGDSFAGSDNIFSSHQIRHQSWVSLKMELEEAGALIFCSPVCVNAVKTEIVGTTNLKRPINERYFLHIVAVVSSLFIKMSTSSSRLFFFKSLFEYASVVSPKAQTLNEL
jgi:hypothetical protein